MTDSKCKICRRAGEKLFLKGARCFSPKCAMVRHPTPPGIHGNRRGMRRTASEFGAQLREKQRVRFQYGIREGELERYVHAAQAKKGAVITDTLVDMLERRLDNAVFRAGLALSRSIARHLVSYGHIAVNGKRVSVPSYAVSKNDVIGVMPASAASPLFQGYAERIKKYQPPEWIELDRDAKKATIISLPTVSNTHVQYDIQQLMQFYSK